MVTLRKIKAKDRDSVLDVHKRSVYGLCSKYYREDEIKVWTERLNPERFDEGMKDESNRGWVAEDSGKIVGYGFLNLNAGEIKGLYLLPEYSGKKIGIQILNRLEAVARENQISELVLYSTLNAVPFYEEAGYQKVKDASCPLAPELALHTIYMVKKL